MFTEKNKIWYIILPDYSFSFFDGLVDFDANTKVYNPNLAHKQKHYIVETGCDSESIGGRGYTTGDM